MIMKTTQPRIKEIVRDWHLIDADGEILGRMATKIADLLTGKTKAYFVHNVDCGDWVVVINSQGVRTTGKKLLQKKYQHYSGYPGGLKEITLKELMKKNPNKVILSAVSGMLPKNKLRDRRLKRLKIYSGEEHPYRDKKFLEV